MGDATAEFDAATPSMAQTDAIATAAAQLEEVCRDLTGCLCALPGLVERRAAALLLRAAAVAGWLHLKNAIQVLDQAWVDDKDGPLCGEPRVVPETPAKGSPAGGSNGEEQLANGVTASSDEEDKGLPNGFANGLIGGNDKSESTGVRAALLVKSKRKKMSNSDSDDSAKSPLKGRTSKKKRADNSESGSANDGKISPAKIELCEKSDPDSGISITEPICEPAHSKENHEPSTTDDQNPAVKIGPFEEYDLGLVISNAESFCEPADSEEFIVQTGPEVLENCEPAFGMDFRMTMVFGHSADQDAEQDGSSVGQAPSPGDDPPASDNSSNSAEESPYANSGGQNERYSLAHADDLVPGEDADNLVISNTKLLCVPVHSEEVIVKTVAEEVEPEAPEKTESVVGVNSEANLDVKLDGSSVGDAPSPGSDPQADDDSSSLAEESTSRDIYPEGQNERYRLEHAYFLEPGEDITNLVISSTKLLCEPDPSEQVIVKTKPEVAEEDEPEAPEKTEPAVDVDSEADPVVEQDGSSVGDAPSVDDLPAGMDSSSFVKESPDACSKGQNELDRLVLADDPGPGEDEDHRVMSNTGLLCELAHSEVIVKAVAEEVEREAPEKTEPAVGVDSEVDPDLERNVSSVGDAPSGVDPPAWDDSSSSVNESPYGDSEGQNERYRLAHADDPEAGEDADHLVISNLELRCEYFEEVIFKTVAEEVVLEAPEKTEPAVGVNSEADSDAERCCSSVGYSLFPGGEPPAAVDSSSSMRKSTLPDTNPEGQKERCRLAHADNLGPGEGLDQLVIFNTDLLCEPDRSEAVIVKTVTEEVEPEVVKKTEPAVGVDSEADPEAERDGASVGDALSEEVNPPTGIDSFSFTEESTSPDTNAEEQNKRDWLTLLASSGDGDTDNLRPGEDADHVIISNKEVLCERDHSEEFIVQNEPEVAGEDEPEAPENTKPVVGVDSEADPVAERDRSSVQNAPSPGSDSQVEDDWSSSAEESISPDTNPEGQNERDRLALLASSEDENTDDPGPGGDVPDLDDPGVSESAKARSCNDADCASAASASDSESQDGRKLREQRAMNEEPANSGSDSSGRDAPNSCGRKRGNAKTTAGSVLESGNTTLKSRARWRLGDSDWNSASDDAATRGRRRRDKPKRSVSKSSVDSGCDSGAARRFERRGRRPRGPTEPTADCSVVLTRLPTKKEQLSEEITQAHRLANVTRFLGTSATEADDSSEGFVAMKENEFDRQKKSFGRCKRSARNASKSSVDSVSDPGAARRYKRRGRRRKRPRGPADPTADCSVVLARLPPEIVNEATENGFVKITERAKKQVSEEDIQVRHLTNVAALLRTSALKAGGSSDDSDDNYSEKKERKKRKEASWTGTKKFAKKKKTLMDMSDGESGDRPSGEESDEPCTLSTFGIVPIEVNEFDREQLLASDSASEADSESAQEDDSDLAPSGKDKKRSIEKKRKLKKETGESGESRNSRWKEQKGKDKGKQLPAKVLQMLNGKISATDSSEEDDKMKQNMLSRRAKQAKAAAKANVNSDKAHGDEDGNVSSGLPTLVTLLSSGEEEIVRKQIRVMDNSDSDSSICVLESYPAPLKEHAGPSKKRRRSSSLSIHSVSDSANDFEQLKKIPSRGRLKYRIKGLTDDNASSSDDDSVDEVKPASQGSPNKRGRKKIRHIREAEQSTKEAERAELDRRKRIEEKQNMYNELFKKNVASEEPEVLNNLVLDFDLETKKELVSVHQNFVEILKPHQVDGVKFMFDSTIESVKRLEDESNQDNAGCILGHCMGLGKTLQVVVLLHTLLKSKAIRGHISCALVVCPKNTVQNWVRELKNWQKKCRVPDVDVVDITFRKDNYERSFELEQWQKEGGVCVLSYDMFKRLTGTGGKKNFARKVKDRFQKALIDPGPDIIVCDEGHLLKNPRTNAFKSLNQTMCRRRVILTGTPLQNNLREYHTMVEFVKPRLLGSESEFSNRFIRPIENGSVVDAMPRDVKLMKRRSHVLYKLLNSVVQRRDYNVLMPFLPPKLEFTLMVKLSDLQKKLYERYLEKSRGQTTRKVLTAFHALSRVCTHPRSIQMKDEQDDAKEDMRSDRPSVDRLVCAAEWGTEQMILPAGDSGNTAASSWMGTTNKNGPNGEQADDAEWWRSCIPDDIQFEDPNLSGKLMLLDQLLIKCENIGDKLLVFSQSLFSLNVIEEHLARLHKEMQKCRNSDKKHPSHVYFGTWKEDYDYYRLDGSTSEERRQLMCDRINKASNERARLMLISTKAGGLGINLVGANRVVIFDASWNPTADSQAIFRVYRFGQVKPSYVYRFIAQGCMEEKIYDRQITKLSLSCRVVDEQQVERHFNQHDVEELYEFEPDRKRTTGLIVPKDDLVLMELVSEQSEWVSSVHSHDSLLQNVADEELNADEQRAAWEEYENDRRGTPKVGDLIPVIEGKMINKAIVIQMIKKDNPTATDNEVLLLIPRAIQTLRAYYLKKQRQESAQEGQREQAEGYANADVNTFTYVQLLEMVAKRRVPLTSVAPEAAASHSRHQAAAPDPAFTARDANVSQQRRAHIAAEQERRRIVIRRRADGVMRALNEVTSSRQELQETAASSRQEVNTATSSRQEVDEAAADSRQVEARMVGGSGAGSAAPRSLRSPDNSREVSEESSFKRHYKMVNYTSATGKISRVLVPCLPPEK